MELNLYAESYNFFCDSIPKLNAKLLEIGCGPGNITKYLISKRPDFDIFGIDVAPNMVRLARKNNPTAQFVEFDCRKINHLERKFDGIIGGFCLPYLSEIECSELISNTFDLLNYDGFLYLSFVEGDPGKSDFKTSGMGRVFFYYHKLEEIQLQLNRLQFEEVNIFRVPYKISDTDFDIHTILTARKKAQ